MIDVGATVGNYQVLKKIGAGAMGSVFLAHHPVIGKRIALKVIHPELASNEEMIARFFNEARAVTQIGHQNIVDVQDFGQTPDGDSFIVMELLEGMSLGDRLKQDGPFSNARATHVALQLADGLAAAHARGIIHRDLKPDNIFLISRSGDPDFVKILDFGLAKLTGPSQAVSHQTKTGSLLGTPHYMAPEQAENVKKVDNRADVYSLGCILFQLLTGRVPFPGDGFGEVLVRHVREPPPLPSRLNPAVPPALEKIVLHALAKKPEFRFASMDQFRQALSDPERFSQTLDGHGGVQLTPDDGMPAVNPRAPAMVGIGPPPPAPPAPPARLAPQLSHEAPTMLAEAPDPAVIARATAEAQKQRHQASTSPTARRPEPARAVLPPPGKQAAADPPSRAGPQAPSRVGLLAVTTLVVVAAGAAAWYFGIGPGRGGSVAVTVTTDPAGAEVLDGERSLGTTPIVVKLPRDREAHSLSVKKDGYLTAQRLVTATEDRTLALRLTPTPPVEPEEPPTPPTAPRGAIAVAPPPLSPPAPPAPAKPHSKPPSLTAPKKHHSRPHGEAPLILTPSF